MSDKPALTDEPFGYVVEHTYGVTEFVKVCPYLDTAIACHSVYTAEQMRAALAAQAEAHAAEVARLQVSREHIMAGLLATDEELLNVRDDCDALRAERADEPVACVTDEMVNRFLGWKLPEDFAPDCGITFKPMRNEHMPWGGDKNEPVGTNLLTAVQARKMLEYVVGVSGVATPQPSAWVGGNGHPHHISAVQTATDKRLYGPWKPLYAAPLPPAQPEPVSAADESAQLEPLSDAEIDEIILRLMDTTGASLRNVARAIERAVTERLKEKS